MLGNLEPVTAVAFADRAGGPLAVSTNDAPATSTSSASPSSRYSARASSDGPACFLPPKPGSANAIDTAAGADRETSAGRERSAGATVGDQ